MDTSPRSSPEIQGRIFSLCEVPFTLKLSPGTRVECLEGVTWLTASRSRETKDVEDNMLVSGQVFLVVRCTTIHVSSLRRTPTRIRVLENATAVERAQQGILTRLQRLFGGSH